VVPASTKRGGEDDGGALRSSLAVYCVPLYAALARPSEDTRRVVVTEAMVAYALGHAQQDVYALGPNAPELQSDRAVEAYKHSRLAHHLDAALNAGAGQ
jgi:hypothetical protein